VAMVLKRHLRSAVADNDDEIVVIAAFPIVGGVT